MFGWWQFIDTLVWSPGFLKIDRHPEVEAKQPQIDCWTATKKGKITIKMQNKSKDTDKKCVRNTSQTATSGFVFTVGACEIEYAIISIP